MGAARYRGTEGLLMVQAELTKSHDALRPSVSCLCHRGLTAARNLSFLSLL